MRDSPPVVFVGICLDIRDKENPKRQWVLSKSRSFTLNSIILSYAGETLMVDVAMNFQHQ
jgi:hypothetical protein